MPIDTSRTSPWAWQISLRRSEVMPIIFSVEETEASKVEAMVLYRVETSCWAEGEVGVGVGFGLVRVM